MVGVDDPDFNITPEQAVAAFYEVFEFGRQAIENLRWTPGEGLLSALARFPDQRQYLIENPDGWSTAVEELLRFVSPVIHMRRTAAANRDPEVFARPDTLKAHVIRSWTAAHGRRSG